MPRRTRTTLALAACLLGTGHALLEAEARAELREQLEQAQPYRDLFGQIAKAVADKAAQSAAPGSPVQPGGPVDMKEMGKKAQEWIQSQVTPLLRGAKAAAPQANPAAGLLKMAGEALQKAAKQAPAPQANPTAGLVKMAGEALQKSLKQANTIAIVKMAGEGLQKAAKQAADGAAKAAKEAADAVTPDSVKFLTRANSAGFTSNVMSVKQDPKDGRTFVGLASNSGLFNPKTGMAGILGSVVNQDRSAKTGSLAVAYSPSNKPVFLSMDMELPARTGKGMRLTQALSEKVREGQSHASNLRTEMEATLEKELPQAP